MIGATTSQSLDLTLLNKGDIVYGTSTIKVEIGLKIGSTIEYIPMGIYNIDDIEKTDYTIKITAFDNMMKFERNFITNLGDTLTLQQVVNELVRITGVQFTGTLPAYTVKKLEGFSCREVLNYVASLCGGNAVITRDGKFTIVTPKDNNYAIGTANYFDYTREESKYKIGKISCQVGEKVLSKGTLGADSMELEFENPWITTAILNDIYTKLNGFEYLGYSMKWQGDLSLDVGDIVTITDKKGVVRKHPILSQKFTYTGGLTSEISAKGENKNKNEFSSSGSTAKKIERIVTELAIVNKALIDVAYIGDLTAGNIKFDTASGTILDLQTLLSKFVTGENGQFLNLTTDNVTISNALIKDVIAKNISVEDLKAGKISTNKFRITSENGGIEIVGATQQFKDKNNKVRIQMGQDAQGNFNFILRGEDGTTTLIDHTGIKEKAIADNLIKSNMVAENAIGENQINYSSLVTGLNKDTNTQLIKASKVAIDLTGQSLEVSFNSLKSNVDNKETRNLLSNSVLNWELGTCDYLKPAGSDYNSIKLVHSTRIRTKDLIEINSNFTLSINNDLFSCAIYFFDENKKYLGQTAGVVYWLYNKYFHNKEAKYIALLLRYNDDRKMNSSDILNAQVKVEKGENLYPVYSQAPEDVEEKIEANTTAISVTQKGIDALVKETSIVKGDITTLKDNYTSIKATTEGLSTTVVGHTTSITNAQNTADSKAKVFTSTPTTPYKVGDIWTGGPSGEIMKCKVARSSGAYVASDWEKASKYTDDTKANAVEGKVTEVETKQATLEQNLNGFKTTVSNTYSTKTELNTAKTDAINSANNSTDNKLKNYSTTTAMNTAISQSASDITSTVSNTYATKTELGKTTTRVESVENKVTATALTTTISSAINNGTSTITTTQFVMDRTGFTIKNGAIKIQNNSGTVVLQGDTSGTLYAKDGAIVVAGTATEVWNNYGYRTTLLKNGIKLNWDASSSGGGSPPAQVSILLDYNKSGIVIDGFAKSNLTVASSVNLYIDSTLNANNGIDVASGNISFSKIGTEQQLRFEGGGNDKHLCYFYSGNSTSTTRVGLYDNTSADVVWRWATDNIFYINKVLNVPRIIGRDNNSISLGSGNCRIDPTDGILRLFTQAYGYNDSGISIGGDGGVTIKSYNVIKHSFNANGTKTGGSMEIEGTIYGMSPTDSPQTLIEYIIPDVVVEGELNLEIDPIYIKMISYYVVFLSNKNIEVKEKRQDYITLVGNGTTDILIKGQRKGADSYYRIMGGIEHGVTEGQTV